MPHENTEGNGTTVGPRCGRCYGDGEVPCECGGAWGCPTGAKAPCPACTKPEASADPCMCEMCLTYGGRSRREPVSPAYKSERDHLRQCFKMAQGAFADAATIIVPDEPEQVADAVRALTAERDAARTAERERIAGLAEAFADALDERAGHARIALQFEVRDKLEYQADGVRAFAAKLRAEGT